MANENTGSRIYEQIEQSADFYQPAVYELLSFYHALDNQSDPLDGQFVPMTTVQNISAKDVKIFAVGLIPPASKVTGRMLDRTQSVLALSSDYATLIQNNPDVGTSSTGDTPGQTSGIATSLAPPVGPTATNSDDFFLQYVAMCNRLGVQAEELAKVIQSESGWRANEGAVRNGNTVAKGLIQLTKKTAMGLGMTAEQYETFQNTRDVDQLPWIEKFYQNRSKGKTAAQLKAITFGGFNNPDGSIYSSFAEPPDYKRSDFQKIAYLQNKNLDSPPPPKGYITPEDLDKKLAKIRVGQSVLANIAQAKADLGMAAFAPLIREEDPPAPDADWQNEGADNASQSALSISLAANKSLNQANLGKRFLEAQLATVRLMQEALDTMARTPPLRLLINPQSFRVQASKVISDGNWGRSGPIIEHWGDDQDKIEGSGKVAAFYSMDAFDANGPGLTRTARQFSASYQNLLSLWLIYKNNGGVWFPDPVSPSGSKAKNLSVVGSVYLYYDDILYIGSFDNFTITEAETEPFTLEYSFSFSVRAWYILNHLDDKQYTYGPPNPSPLQTGTANSPTFGGNNAQPSPNVALPQLSTADDPLFGINDGDIGDDLEGI